MKKKSATYNRNNPVIFQQRIQALKKLEREEINGLCASCKYVVNDVIVPDGTSSSIVNERHGVFDHRRVVSGESEVFKSKLVDNRVKFDNCGIDPMCDQCRRCRPNS